MTNSKTLCSTSAGPLKSIWMLLVLAADASASSDPWPFTGNTFRSVAWQKHQRPTIFTFEFLQTLFLAFASKTQIEIQDFQVSRLRSKLKSFRWGLVDLSIVPKQLPDFLQVKSRARITGESPEHEGFVQSRCQWHSNITTSPLGQTLNGFETILVLVSTKSKANLKRIPTCDSVVSERKSLPQEHSDRNKLGTIYVKFSDIRIVSKGSWLTHLPPWAKLQSAPATLLCTALCRSGFWEIRLRCMVSLTEGASAHQRPSAVWRWPKAWENHC